MASTLRKVAAAVSAALVVTGFAAATGHASVRAAANVCTLVAPSPPALAKALGGVGFAPYASPPWCGVGGPGGESAKIYLYPAGQAKTLAASFASFLVPAKPAPLKLRGIPPSATITKDGSDAWFTKGSHFVIIQGFGLTPAKLAALTRAVYLKVHT